MEQKNYTLKECRAFNQKQLESTTAFIKGNFANGECKELTIPDEAHPWNILHAVIDQYYKRESEIAQVIDNSNCTAIDEAALSGINQEQSKAFQELMKWYSPAGWAAQMGNVLDRLIFAIYHADSDKVADSLSHIRILQKFFMGLEKELN